MNIKSKSKTFDEFYYLATQRNHNFNEIDDYAEQHKGNYTPYKEKIRCPECRIAELIFIPKYPPKRAYLKKIPSSNHHQNCSYNYKYASNKTIKEHINTLNEQQVENKLVSIMRFLTKLDNYNGNNTESLLLPIEQNPLSIQDNSNPEKERKVLRRKKLIGYIDKEDVGDHLYLIYGDVQLSIEEKEGVNRNTKQKFNYYILSVKTLNKNNEWKFRCSIYRGNNKDNIDEKAVYKIAMIGCFDFSNKYLKINLLNKSAIKYEKV